MNGHILQVAVGAYAGILARIGEIFGRFLGDLFRLSWKCVLFRALRI